MKYRIKPFDLINDIWLLQERWLFFFWLTKGAGREVEVLKKAEELNKKH